MGTVPQDADTHTHPPPYSPPLLPFPQDPNDDVEVLSGGPVSTNDYDYPDSGLPGFVGFWSPRQVPQDSAPEDSAPESESECGFMCTVFKDLFNFDGIQEHIDAMKDQENEIDGDFDEDGFAVNNSTHTKKVLP